ncbi:MAG: hypothetical protein CSB48_11595 [Proteobacteria bacterium]|nr:MAG: hypothetical protein CSB48_11595 [Pseudomonadota bacterium]PIE40117.1 MAG: hypothetical protein CSA51_02450 [Gammaproteobacteria bacterium]
MSSGVLALADDLADMRDMVDSTKLTTKQTMNRTITLRAETVAPEATRLDKSALTGKSGGVDATRMKVQADQVALASREITRLQARKEEKKAIRKKQVEKRSGKRSNEEVRRVFDRNKSAIDRIYQRALRKNPSLEGKVVLRLTIEPSGAVSSCVIVSSELGDKKLERKIVARVKLFNFGQKANVDRTVYEFPIDFLPG